MRTIFFQIVLILGISGISIGQNKLMPPLPKDSYIPGKIILKLKAENSRIFQDKGVQFESLNKELNITSVEQKFPKSLKPAKGDKKYGIELPDITLIYELEYNSLLSIEKAMELLIQKGYFEYVYPHYVEDIFYTPNDPSIGSQYALGKISAFAAWDICQSDTNKVVAITDTGFEFNHPDLVNAVKYNFYDPIDGIDNDNDGYTDNFKGWDVGQMDNNPQFGTNGHGIHVSGITGASVNNTFGMAGVGFKTKLLPVKIDNANGQIISGYEGIIYAADHGADIINCSWGSAYYAGSYIQDIINYASLVRGSLVVAACGNSYSDVPFYPASGTFVMSVAASNSMDKKWSNSSYGYFVDVSAPGEAIYSTWGGASFTTSSGTSMASPLVAGAAALVSSYYPELNNLQIAEILRNSADSIDQISGNESYAGRLGTGRINLYRALTDTLRPSIRLTNHRFLNNLFGIGDTISLITYYTNYLSTSLNTKVRIECNSPYVELLDSTYFQGDMNTLQSDSNNISPFRLKLKSNLPSNYNLQILVYFESDNAFSRDPINYIVNTDYFQLDTNNISVTIVGNSNLGYNDGYLMMQGKGLTYKNRNNMLTMAGFIAGANSTSISDNVYGFSTPGDTDFSMSYPTMPINNPIYGDKSFLSQFSDTNLTTNSNKIKVNQYSYEWNSVEDANFMILKYDVISLNELEQNNFYTGFFADWDINPSSSNRAGYDPIGDLIVAHNLDSSMFVGLVRLEPEIGNHYLFDMDGFNSIIAISDGFSGLEKYTALTNNRNAAGESFAGNDVAMMMSGGPFTLQNGDTITFAIAVIAGENITEVRDAAERARLRYSDPLLGYNENRLDPTRGIIYPNPADQYFIIKRPNNSKQELLTITDINGRIVLQSELNAQENTIETKQLTPGCYYLSVGSEKQLLIIGR